MVNLELKSKVCNMAVKCYREGMFAGTSGNLSIYDVTSGYMYITPSSYSYEKLTPDDIMVSTLDGEIIEGTHKPSSEWRMHAVIYKESAPAVQAVVHTHSPYATAFAVSREEIPVILIEMVPFLNGNVPLAEFAIPGTDEVGLNAVKALHERNACLMENHGVLAVGTNLDQAYIRAVYVEDAAKICAIAKAGVGPIAVIDEKHITFMRNRGKAKVAERV